MHVHCIKIVNLHLVTFPIEKDVMLSCYWTSGYKTILSWRSGAYMRIGILLY